jgi:outer membrane biosynthesis protein TonB
MLRILPLVVVVTACGSGGNKVEPALAPEAYDEPAADLDAGADNPGEVSMAAVEANMGPVREDVQACAAITTYEGKVTVQVVIAPDGSATAEIVSGSGKPEIDGCVVDAFDDVAFPTSERGQRFKYSFTF